MYGLDPLDGHTYHQAGDIQRQRGYHDVTPALLRTWVYEGHLRPVTCAELATAYGLAAPPADRADQPARVTGPSGPENVYRWDHVVRAETRTRRRGTGPTRGRAPRRRAALAAT